MSDFLNAFWCSHFTLKQWRTFWIIAQCRSMPINSSKSGIDGQWSPLRSISSSIERNWLPINIGIDGISDQCLNFDWHWLELGNIKSRESWQWHICHSAIQEINWAGHDGEKWPDCDKQCTVYLTCMSAILIWYGSTMSCRGAMSMMSSYVIRLQEKCKFGHWKILLLASNRHKRKERGLVEKTH